MAANIDILRPDHPKRVLIVASNPTVSTITGWPLGFWWSELTHPWWEFTEHGYQVEIASPDGGALRGDSWSDPRDESGYSEHGLTSRGFIESPRHAAVAYRHERGNEETRRRSNHMRTRSVFVLALVAVLCAWPASGQEQVGSISGQVTDAESGVLPGATIELTGPGIATLVSTADQRGNYRFPRVPPGVYTVTAPLEGFQAEQTTQVRVTVARESPVDFELQSEFTEEILVTGERTPIDVGSNAVNPTISREQLELVPRGRDFSAAVDQVAGVEQPMTPSYTKRCKGPWGQHTPTSDASQSSTSVTAVFRSAFVNLYTSDIEAGVRFYRDLLGFTETFRTPTEGIPEHIEMVLDGFMLGLGTVEAARRVHGVDATPGSPAMVIVVWVDDVDRAYADLEAAGVVTLQPPHDTGNNNRNALLRDPDGNLVELVAKRS